jgi:hypothetical protein
MVPVLDKPSSLIHEIRMTKVGSWSLFRFSDSLQDRMELLLERKKADLLTDEEAGELEATLAATAKPIGELDRIFTHINAMVAAEHGNQ